MSDEDKARAEIYAAAYKLAALIGVEQTRRLLDHVSGSIGSISWDTSNPGNR